MKLSLSTFLFAVAAFAAPQKWTGQVTDSMCGANHAVMSSAGKTVDPQECTLMCTKGGSKFAFVAGGKVFEISNQDFTDLTNHAGKMVKLTGDLGTDGKTITVSKLEPKT